MEELNRRRVLSANKFEELRGKLQASERLIQGKACVYATGSYGRQEASAHSDLDLFIVGMKNGKAAKDQIEGSRLRELDAICVKADLIEATRTSAIKDFDGDGKYLSHFSVHKVTKTLGTPEDDAANTFTARLLLLLESSPLLESNIYDEIIEEVLASYWRDFQDHKAEFVPAYLANDILRLWRTFCVNYEARTQREPAQKKAAGKLKNYKLKHGRILTCYSALLYLLAVFDRTGTVSPADAKNMVSLTPTKRLQWLLDQKELHDVQKSIEPLLNQYNKFLIDTDCDEQEMVERFKDKAKVKLYIAESYKFGDLMFNALNEVGKNSRLHRLIVV